MKKYICMLMLLLLIFSMTKVSHADINDYTAFSSINVSNGKLLRDYTKDELDAALDETKDRRFSGWRIKLFNKNVPCEFISSTLFSMYNTGTTAIKYKLQVNAENTVKTSISSTGSIEYSVKGDGKVFSNKLDTALKIEYDYSETALVKETEELNIEIDPNTLCIVYIKGTGLLTNGVARYYSFWISQNKGGFEYFTITDSYVRIEKIAL